LTLWQFLLMLQNKMNLFTLKKKMVKTMDNQMITLSCQICEEPTVEVALEDSKYLVATCQECWG
jgi:hypothetical protein